MDVMEAALPDAFKGLGLFAEMQVPDVTVNEVA